MRSQVAIIGGGIGGLGAALSLFRAGFDVHVYEQARVFREAGAGIQVSPNASCILHGLGLADELAGFGVRPLAIHQRRWDNGRTLLKAPIGDTVVATVSTRNLRMARASRPTLLLALTEFIQRSAGCYSDLKIRVSLVA